MNERTVTIVAVSFLVVIVLAGGGAIYYFHGVLDERETTHTSRLADVNDAKDKQRAIPKLKEQIKKLEADIAEGDRRIPKLDDLQYDELAELIDALRKQSSTFVQDARYSPSRGGPGLAPSMNRATYDVSVRGGFFNLLRFVNLLEAQTRFVAVDDFSISGGSEETGRIPIREMRIRLYSFARKPMNLPGEQGAPLPTADKATTEPPKAVPSTPLPN